MNAQRLWIVARRDYVDALQKPLFIGWSLFMALNAWAISRGTWIFRSSDTSMGGDVSWVNSEFQIAFVLSLSTFLFLAFLAALAPAMPLIRDRRYRIRELIDATPLSTTEYTWAKFGAGVALALSVVAIFLAILTLFCHAIPDPKMLAAYAPFSWSIYLRPALVFVVPSLLFVGGIAFALAAWTGRPMLVYLLPTFAFVAFNQFVWSWFPSDLDPSIAAIINFVDPSGFRWLKQNWLMVDRGIEFYNNNPIEYGTAFLSSRIAIGATGLAAVMLSTRRLGVRVTTASSRWWWGKRAKQQSQKPSGETLGQVVGQESRRSIRTNPLHMGQRSPQLWRNAWTVAKFEGREFRGQVGFYVVLPLTFFLVRLSQGAASGPYADLPMMTSGTAATQPMTALGIWIVLLVMFSVVESLRRESSNRVDPVYASVPVSNASIVLGKGLANAGIVFATLAVAFLTSILGVVLEPGVTIEVWPFVYVWGYILLPTFFAWGALVMVIYNLTQSRYGTYAIGIAVIGTTQTAFVLGDLSWAGNWPMLGELLWSDFGLFELDRQAIAMNRAMVLTGGAFFSVLAARSYVRRRPDALRPRWRSLYRGWRDGWFLSALGGVPIGLCILLWIKVEAGFEGKTVSEARKNYWRYHLATWQSTPLPSIHAVDLNLDFDPQHRQVTVHGHYELQNDTAVSLPWIPVTGGSAWEALRWTWNDQTVEPEHIMGMYVFRPKIPMASHSQARLGFEYQATIRGGISKNGGDFALAEFILPSGIVLTGRNPDFLPRIGYVKELGIDDENRYEPPRFPPGYHVGVTPGDIDRSPFSSRVRISIPRAYRANSTGVLVSDKVEGPTRKMLWETSYPVRVVNVIAGQWEQRRGEEDTAIFHHPDHTYNLDSMMMALDGARRHYEQWFAPYPWAELRVSEFPNVSRYARGNPTNIFFSEGIGFLVHRRPDFDLAFETTAHEVAHQWWGHIVSHGDAPGGIVLSEGGAEFASLMLVEELKGKSARMEKAKRLEFAYGELRQRSSEKPLNQTFMYRPGDRLVVYNSVQQGSLGILDAHATYGTRAFSFRHRQVFSNLPSQPRPPGARRSCKCPPALRQGPLGIRAVHEYGVL